MRNNILLIVFTALFLAGCQTKQNITLFGIDWNIVQSVEVNANLPIGSVSEACSIWDQVPVDSTYKCSCTASDTGDY